jgi:predicted adenine nucleotide alpha hydrolase (AANH) superfamily ATPase
MKKYLFEVGQQLADQFYNQKNIKPLNQSKMKTAVEWVTEKFMTENTTREGWHEIFEQAKEMEKQNIIESYCQGCFDISKDNGIVPRETSEDYYNRTFKSE